MGYEEGWVGRIRTGCLNPEFVKQKEIQSGIIQVYFSIGSHTVENFLGHSGNAGTDCLKEK